MSSFVSRLTRRKNVVTKEVETFDRCLTTVDLTALGVGATLGVGIYVLAGEVAKDTAGPAVILSFLIAGAASFLSALCYAELGARVPLCGSAYVYSYVAVGEFVGFVIGWNLLLEYVIGTASVARAYSGYLDSLFNDTMQHHFRSAMPININFLSPYPDFFAFFITLALTVILSIGVKESTRFNNIFTCLNIAVVLFVTVFGFIHADVKNWHIPKTDVPLKNGTGSYGDGGFLPYGVNGVLSGAATCFYGFVGFDAIATSGEEAKNPQRSIPIALILSLLVIFLSYCGISSVLTLMVPYYLQDVNAPLPDAFIQVGWPAGRWIVTIGALFGLSTSLLGAMFPLPRVIYAMASDGVIFRWLGQIHPKFQTPFWATLLSGFVTGVLAMVFDLKSLVDMMSIGTLMAYMIVSACVIILHYKVVQDDHKFHDLTNDADVQEEESEEEETEVDSANLISNEGKSSLLVQLFNLRSRKVPTESTARLSLYLLFCYIISATGEAVILARFLDKLEMLSTAVIIPLAVFTFLVFLLLFCLSLQPQNNEKLTFKVPWVPMLPALSIFVNIYLMMKLSVATWIRFLVWLSIGLAIYGFYGWRNSSEEYRAKGLVPPNEEQCEQRNEDNQMERSQSYGTMS